MEINQEIVDAKAIILKATAFFLGRYSEPIPWEAVADNDQTDLEIYGVVRTVQYDTQRI